MYKTWPGNVVNLSMPALPVKYAFLLEQNRKCALRVALIYTVIISLSLAIIIALLTEGLRRRATFTGKDAE